MTALRALLGAYRTAGWPSLATKRFWSGLVKSPYAYLGNGEALVQIYSGNSMFVDTRDAGVGAPIIMNGYYEHFVERLFRREIRPGQTVVDIEANIGYHTLAMASIVGSSGRVIAIEPQTPTFEKLNRTLC